MSQKRNESYQGGMLDIIGAENVEVELSEDPAGRSVLYVNTEHGCKLRIGRVKSVKLMGLLVKKE